MKASKITIGILIFLTSNFILRSATIDTISESKFEVFPLVAYDTDIGLGLGAKAFYLSPLHKNESFDLIVFGSTKGETWIKFAFSIPDFEIRQGKRYDWGLDLVFDYDKWINSSYFGIGNGSEFKDRIYYTKEPIDLSLNLSRGFTEVFQGQLGIRFKNISMFNIDSSENNNPDYIRIKPSSRHQFSYFLKAIYDTRDSYINPSTGFYAEGAIENAALSPDNRSYIKYSLELQGFYELGFISTVLAARFKTEFLNKTGLPFHVLLPAGGNRTLRGYTQDRFMDASTGIANFELRFPIPGLDRFGGIVGFDAGRVWPDIRHFGFSDWKSNGAVGLRYYMDTFVVRADVGFSSESTNLYLNIGHMF